MVVFVCRRALTPRPRRCRRQQSVGWAARDPSRIDACASLLPRAQARAKVGGRGWLLPPRPGVGVLTNWRHLRASARTGSVSV
eukprot:3230567-Prymnesium_polylepis.1